MMLSHVKKKTTGKSQSEQLVTSNESDHSDKLCYIKGRQG